MFPLFYVIREFHRFLHRGKAKNLVLHGNHGKQTSKGISKGTNVERLRKEFIAADFTATRTLFARTSAPEFAHRDLPITLKIGEGNLQFGGFLMSVYMK